MADKDRTPDDLAKIHSPTSDQLNLINKAMRKTSNQDAVKRTGTGFVAQHETTNLEAISPKIDSATELYYGLPVSAKHDEEQEDALADQLKTGEGEELTNRYSYLSPSSIKETLLSKKSRMDDEGQIITSLAQLTVHANIDISCPESSTKIDDPFEQVTDLDKFKKEEEDDIGDIGLLSKAELGEKEMKKADADQQQGCAGAGHVPTSMEEADQEIQAATLGGDEGQARREEVENKADYMKRMNATIAFITNQCYEKKNRIPTFGTSIEKFAEDMYGWIHGAKAYFKKDQHGVERISVLEWLKEHVQSSEDKQDFQDLRDKAGKMATKLSSLLVTLMVFMLETEVMEAKLEVLNSSLKWLFEETDSMVTRMVVSVVGKTGYPVIEKRKLMVDSRVVQAPLRIDLTESNQFERVIVSVLYEIQRLDYILMQQFDPNVSVKELMYPRKTELDLCEKELDMVEDLINHFKDLYGFNFETELDAFQQIELDIDTVSKEAWQSEENYADKSSWLSDDSTS